MTDIKGAKPKRVGMPMTLERAIPWIEPGLYVECPKCGFCHLIESDHSVSLPSEDFDMSCNKCGLDFIVEGES